MHNLRIFTRGGMMIAFIVIMIVVGGCYHGRR